MRRCRIVSGFLILMIPALLNADEPASSPPFVVVLGNAQDGGYPQAGCNRPHCEPGWRDPSKRRFVAALAIVDPSTNQRWLIDATPDFPLQLRLLDEVHPVDWSPGVNGVFLTHAHIGHYVGLVHFGREVMGSRDVEVGAMPRMAGFLRNNGPWDQLVRLGNIDLVPLTDGKMVRLNERLSVTPFLVPHRDEYTETVGYRIAGPDHSILYIPDIDKWERWNVRVESMIAQADVALLDGTFYSEGELPGRSMAEVPHPFIVESMKRFAALPEGEKNKIRFIHLNHTNPALDPESDARRDVEKAGFLIADQGDRFGL